ncbi:MAG: alpha/beta fold hydrolase [Bryobacterales bacterium]|nr:alpha/beta fold hydrolase [Bryobacterales bacterium]
MRTATASLLLAAALLPGAPLPEQATPKGTPVRITVHAASLEGNLSSDPAARSVSVWLPPNYDKETKRRYPVVYFLHGFSDSDQKWFRDEKHWINLPKTLDEAAAAGSGGMIVVMPDAYTRFGGSMYSSSPATGDWESFVARELVSYMDSHYRTLPRRESRALAGHSMGGYGTIRIGMKFPEVFSALYALSPCCLSPGFGTGGRGATLDFSHVRTDADVAQLSFGGKVMLAASAAWSPNPANPPLYVDLPFQDGALVASVQQRWTANAPLAFLDQYIAHLKRYKAIAFDAGDKDSGIARDSRVLDARLTAYGITHRFAIYDGDHLNRIAGRIVTEVMPLFARTLDSGPVKKPRAAR